MLKRWFSPRAQLSLEQQARLARWQALPPVDNNGSFTRARYVVLDVETTGLNLMTDTLISIGAVAVVNARIAFADSFSVVLQQRATSRKENILIHGISGSVQLEGVPPADALLDFLEFIGKDPLIAFHVTFDETMIKRALHQFLGINFKHTWLDLAYVMPALNPSLMRSHRVLDDWIARYAIHIEARHNALADAFATAQLLLIAQTQALQQQINTFSKLRDLERAQCWSGV